MRSFATFIFALGCCAAFGSEDVPPELRILSSLRVIGVRTDTVIMDGKANDPVCEASRQFDHDWGGGKDIDKKDALSRQITTYVARRTKFYKPLILSLDSSTTGSLSPDLYFRVNITHIAAGGPKRLAFCTVECGIDEPVRPMRDKDLVIRARTWSRTKSACVSEENEIETVKGAVRELLDVFGKDFCLATPTWITGGGGTEWRVRR